MDYRKLFEEKTGKEKPVMSDYVGDVVKHAVDRGNYFVELSDFLLSQLKERDEEVENFKKYITMSKIKTDEELEEENEIPICTNCGSTVPNHIC
jgi:hypothetical protein